MDGTSTAWAQNLWPWELACQENASIPPVSPIHPRAVYFPPLAGRGRRAKSDAFGIAKGAAGEGGFSTNSVPETPPRPNPLPASGEREPTADAAAALLVIF